MKLHNRKKKANFFFLFLSHSNLTTFSLSHIVPHDSFLKIDDKLFTQSTVEKMKAMYNNYEQDALINEYVSPAERKEEDDFIDAILATPVLRWNPTRLKKDEKHIEIFFASPFQTRDELFIAEGSRDERFADPSRAVKDNLV